MAWMSDWLVMLMMRPGPVLRRHLPRRGPAPEHVAVQVGRQQAVPLLGLELEEGLDEDARGVVDPDVEAAPALHDLVGHVVDVGLVRGRALDDQRLSTVGLDEAPRDGRALGILLEVAGHVGALAREGLRDGSADAGGEAGDDGVLALEAEGGAHVAPP